MPQFLVIAMDNSRSHGDKGTCGCKQVVPFTLLDIPETTTHDNSAPHLILMLPNFDPSTVESLIYLAFLGIHFDINLRAILPTTPTPIIEASDDCLVDGSLPRASGSILALFLGASSLASGASCSIGAGDPISAVLLQQLLGRHTFLGPCAMSLRSTFSSKRSLQQAPIHEEASLGAPLLGRAA